MKVRLRRQNGEVEDVAKLDAVEIVDTQGLLGMVILTDHRDVVRAMVPGDPLFTAYCRANGMAAAQVHLHDPFPVKRGG